MYYTCACMKKIGNGDFSSVCPHCGTPPVFIPITTPALAKELAERREFSARSIRFRLLDIHKGVFTVEPVDDADDVSYHYTCQCGRFSSKYPNIHSFCQICGTPFTKAVKDERKEDTDGNAETR